MHLVLDPPPERMRAHGRLRRAAARYFEVPLSYVARREFLSLLLPAVLCVALAWLLVGRTGYPAPRIEDEFSYLLAADTFASGRAANPTHPVWVYFETPHVLHQPSYVSVYPPAQGLILGVGQFLTGHPWYGVLASAAIMCASIGWMLRAWLPLRWAVLGSLIAVQIAVFGSAHSTGYWSFSHGYWIASYWGGAVAAIGGALVLGALGRIRKRLSARQSIILAIGAGILANSRPYEGLVFIAGVGVVLLLWFFDKVFPPAAWLRMFLLPAGITMLVVLGAMAFYNWQATGNPLRLPYQEYLDTYQERRMFLWGEGKPKSYNHESLRRVYEYIRDQQAVPLQEKLPIVGKRLAMFYFGPVLLAVLLLVPLVLKDRRFRPLMICLAVAAIGLAGVEWIYIHYLAPLTGLLIALTVQCLRHLAVWRPGSLPVGRFATVALLLSSFLVTGANAWIGRGWHRTGWALEREQIINKLEATGEQHLILVRYAENHNPNIEWVYNAADIDASPVIWAREMADNTPLLEYFAGRKIWLLDADKQPLGIQPHPSTATR